MITIVLHDLEYKGERQFEELRDLIYGDKMLNTGCLGATYSPIKKVGIFAFINFKSIPESMQKYAKHYHPAISHRHDEDGTPVITE